MGKIIYISGIDGAGKTTVSKTILKDMKYKTKTGNIRNIGKVASNKIYKYIYGIEYN